MSIHLSKCVIIIYFLIHVLESFPFCQLIVRWFPRYAIFLILYEKNQGDVFFGKTKHCINLNHNNFWTNLSIFSIVPPKHPIWIIIKSHEVEWRSTVFYFQHTVQMYSLLANTLPFLPPPAILRMTPEQHIRKRTKKEKVISRY